ncbi:hypothetical protein V8G54_020248 [Vigna mungo]|uniref:Uncharacterized protein n=1 Tax=Vigna mungo TaxID=3915 RepID=A0AAQ3RUJ1_VIGMU
MFDLTLYRALVHQVCPSSCLRSSGLPSVTSSISTFEHGLHRVVDLNVRPLPPSRRRSPPSISVSFLPFVPFVDLAIDLTDSIFELVGSCYLLPTRYGLACDHVVWLCDEDCMEGGSICIVVWLPGLLTSVDDGCVWRSVLVTLLLYDMVVNGSGEDEFDTVYLDDDLRVVKDIRGDYLVVDRASYNWKE